MIVPIGIAFAVVILAIIVTMLMRRHLREKYAVMWLVIGAAMLVLAVFPDLLGALAGQCRRVGIEAGAFSQRLYMAWPQLGIPPYASRRGTRTPHCRRRSTKRTGTTRAASRR